MWQGEWNGLTINVRHLTRADLDEVESVQQDVMRELIDLSHYQSLTTDEFKKILHDETMVGAFYQNRLIAFRALLIPSIDDEHLGRDVHWPEESLDRVIYQEVTNVHPAFRGYGLQTHLGNLLMKELEENEQFNLVCATVAPFNIPSIKDKFTLGLRIGALKEKYGSKLRYVLFKELRKEWAPANQIEYVEMKDTIRQVKLLNEGYTGTELHIESDEWIVRYEK